MVSGAVYAPSALLCVKHGVILNPCRLPLRLSGVVVVIATPDLEVDLSQFTPMENSESWTGVLQAIDARAALVVKTLEDDSNLIFRQSNEIIPMAAGVSILGGVVGTAASSFFPLGLLAGSAAAALYIKYAEYQHEGRLRLLRGILKK